MFAPALVLFSQVADSLSGGGGWLGAGLLGAVLAWLMFKHLPAKDQQVKELIDHLDEVVAKKDEQIDEQRKEFTKAIAEMATASNRAIADLTTAFRAEASAERAACERHFGTLATNMNQSLKTLGDQIAAQSRESAAHSQRNQQWIELMKLEIEKRGGVVPQLPPPYSRPTE